MLNSKTAKDAEKLTVALEGRLDTVTAPELEKCFKESLPGVTELVMDFEKLDYISSAGLRVLLIMKKGCKEGVSLTGLNDICADILMQSGFSEILDIKTDSPR